jgi:hypothetical protein
MGTYYPFTVVCCVLTMLLSAPVIMYDLFLGNNTGVYFNASDLTQTFSVQHNSRAASASARIYLGPNSNAQFCAGLYNLELNYPVTVNFSTELGAVWLFFFRLTCTHVFFIKTTLYLFGNSALPSTVNINNTAEIYSMDPVLVNCMQSTFTSSPPPPLHHHHPPIILTLCIQLMYKVAEL